MIEPTPCFFGNCWALHRLGCIALLFLVSGCASWGPSLPPSDSVAFTVDVPAGWSPANAAGAGGNNSNAESLIRWWQRFNDPLLTTLVTRALSDNSTVNGARAAVREAQSLRDVAAAALRPTLSASGSVQRRSAAGKDIADDFQLGLDARWVPNVFGALGSAVTTADAVVNTSIAKLGDAQVQVASEVALSFILLRSVQSRWVITTHNMSSQLETFQITGWRQQAGLATILEVEQARASLEQTRALLPMLQISIDQTTHALAVLIGQPPAALQVELGKTLRQGVVPQSQSDFVFNVPAKALRQRADVRAAEYQVAAALARVGQAHAQRWPSFLLTGSIGLNAISLATLTKGTSVLSSLVGSINLPIFDGGKGLAQVKSQQAALEQVQQTYRAVILLALTEVENALVAIRNNRIRIASLRLASDSASNAAMIARQRYNSGLIDFQVVLQTERTQFSTQDSLVSASADIGYDQVRLFTALGGGWRFDESTF